MGTLISAFWILSANSWMQTPQGVERIGDRFYVRDFAAVIFNPSFPYRFAHMVIAAFLTTAFVVAGVSAWHLLRDGYRETARRGLVYGLGLAAILAPAQIVAGDQHGLDVREHQPMKVAAMEGLWQTTRGAPLLLFAWPDQAAAVNRYELAVPTLASLILAHSRDGEVKGLNEVAAADRPNVLLVFFAFRVMVGLGFAMLGIAWVGQVLRVRGSLYNARWFLRLAVLAAPAGFVAVIAGWIVAEAGRQPWVVYGQMRTADAVSPVAAGVVTGSLILFVAVYAALLTAYLVYSFKVIRQGPAAAESGEPHLVMAGRP